MNGPIYTMAMLVITRVPICLLDNFHGFTAEVNFGDAMQSTALYMGDLPNWTHQVKGCLDNNFPVAVSTVATG